MTQLILLTQEYPLAIYFKTASVQDAHLHILLAEVVGDGVESFRGAVVGAAVSLLEGAALGMLVGFLDGSWLGVLLGLFEGVMGFLEGAVVGCRLTRSITANQKSENE